MLIRTEKLLFLCVFLLMFVSCKEREKMEQKEVNIAQTDIVSIGITQEEQQEVPLHKEETEPVDMKTIHVKYDDLDVEMQSSDVTEFEVVKLDKQLYANKTIFVRSGPSTDYDKVGVLSKGETVSVIGSVSDGWYKISYGEKEAYVSQDMLVEDAVRTDLSGEMKEVTSEFADNEAESTSVKEEPYLVEREMLFSLMNEQRSANNVAKLSQSGALNNLAHLRAYELSQEFSHTRPNGASCFSVLKDSGIEYRLAGENIASGYADAGTVMDGWMNSEGHRANILNPNYSQVGIGVYGNEDGTGYFWVQIFTGN